MNKLLENKDFIEELSALVVCCKGRRTKAPQN